MGCDDLSVRSVASIPTTYTHNCSTEGGLFVGCDDLSVRSVASIVYIHAQLFYRRGFICGVQRTCR